MIQVYSFEHAEFEDPGYISEWLAFHQIDLHHIKLYAGASLPDPSSVDLLIIMGGPMNIYDEKEFPWLIEEKRGINAIIQARKPVLGICLGAQLIADVLGGSITRSPQAEYGWHTVNQTEHQDNNYVISNMPDIFPARLEVFQWHQDTFSIPPGAHHLYRSDTCPHQAFIYRSHVIALQFHPEMNEESIRGFLSASAYELEKKGLSDLSDKILSNLALCNKGHDFIGGLMAYLTSRPLII
ncbi:MAG TPA: type 1 glutamine amidotransferase [Methanospirillum sp.]|nr:type 1 glutamine amidotransferase [Methanospirillum sp.]